MDDDRVKTAADFGAEGGRARAKNLSKTERSDIARQAAESRWAAEGKLLPKATHEGRLPIGNLQLPVAVLDGGIRVLTSVAVLQALGRPYKGNYKRTNLPIFLEAPNLYPFIHKDLLDVLSPIQYIGLRGRKTLGYRAEILPGVCDVYLSARAAKKLVAQQDRIAKHAEILVRSLSKVGIVALIDEATGFQSGVVGPPPPYDCPPPFFTIRLLRPQCFAWLRSTPIRLKAQDHSS